MNAENIEDIWTDDPDATPSSPTNSFVSSIPPPSFCPPQFDPNAQLTGQQKKLLTIFLYHQHYEIEVMNTIVDLDIDIQRERDEPGVKFVIEELENMQQELVVHREGKRRVEKKINVEEERLSRVVRDKKGDEKDVARRQLREMKAVLVKKDRKEWKVECLR